MNCNQCQEVQGKSCKIIGTCGKDESLNSIYEGIRNFIMVLAKDANAGVYDNPDFIT